MLDCRGLPNTTARRRSATNRMDRLGRGAQLLGLDLQRLLPVTGEIIGRMFERNHIDAAPRAGKRPPSTSLVSAAWNGSVHHRHLHRDSPRFTRAAHEPGHAVHGVLAGERGYLSAQVPLTIAETASVLGEALVFDALREQATTPRAQLELLVERLDDMT